MKNTLTYRYFYIYETTLPQLWKSFSIDIVNLYYIYGNNLPTAGLITKDV